jgi:AcrR family transcriptional regulator
MKQFIANTFVDLVRTNPVSKVSIRLIIETSGVARNTFYYHFDSRSDLMVYTFTRGFDAYLRGSAHGPDLLLLDLAQYLATDRDLYRRLIGQARDAQALIAHIHGLINGYMEWVASQLYPGDSPPIAGMSMLLESLAHYAYHQIVGKALSRAEWGDAGYSDVHLEKYGRIFYELIPFIVSYYGGAAPTVDIVRTASA